MAYIDGNEVLFSATVNTEGVDVEIVQTTGDSTTAVMSQKATTEAIAAAIGGSGSTEKLYLHTVTMQTNDIHGEDVFNFSFSFVSKLATKVSNITPYSWEGFNDYLPELFPISGAISFNETVYPIYNGGIYYDDGWGWVLHLNAVNGAYVYSSSCSLSDYNSFREDVKEIV